MCEKNWFADDLQILNLNCNFWTPHKIKYPPPWPQNDTFSTPYQNVNDFSKYNIILLDHQYTSKSRNFPPRPKNPNHISPNKHSAYVKLARRSSLAI